MDSISVSKKSNKPRSSEECTLNNNRIKDEYMRNTISYEPYSMENTLILTYSEICKQNNYGDFVTITKQKKIYSTDQLALIASDEKRIIFFRTNDNLNTGFRNENNFQDTLFFDHEAKTVFLARRTVTRRNDMKKSGITFLDNNSTNSMTACSTSSDEEDSSEVKKYVGSAIDRIDQQLHALKVDKPDKTRECKPSTSRRGNAKHLEENNK